MMLPVQRERRHVIEPATILLPNMEAQCAVEQERSFTPAIWWNVQVFLMYCFFNTSVHLRNK